MGESTGIAWTDHTFNPVWGCTKISEGCRRCYAATIAEKYRYAVWGPGPRRTFGDQHWREPVAWNRRAVKAGERRRVFCGSMCDIFEDHETTTAQLPRLWLLIRETPMLDWLLLTKRPERITASLPPNWTAWRNVWFGTSIESQDVAHRADALREVPAALRFVSYEPALGPLALDLRGIRWVIYGGESGKGFREDRPEWAASMRAQCASAGAAFFFKQRAALRPGHGAEEWQREFPKVEMQGTFMARSALEKLGE